MVEAEMNLKDMLAREWEDHPMLEEQQCDWETTNNLEDRLCKGRSSTALFFELF